jgi:hypothetical protein
MTTPPAGRYPISERAGQQRYRDGMHPLVIVLIVVGLMLGVGGVVACGSSARKASPGHPRPEQDAHAITDSQASNVHLGSTAASVRAQLGAPATTQEVQGRAKECWLYNISGGKAGDKWRFCFDGHAENAKLVSKFSLRFK